MAGSDDSAQRTADDGFHVWRCRIEEVTSMIRRRPRYRYAADKRFAPWDWRPANRFGRWRKTEGEAVADANRFLDHIDEPFRGARFVGPEEDQ